MEERRLLFVTSNKNKFEEARATVNPFGFNLEHYKASFPEIRADDVEEVALSSAKDIYKELKRPLVVDDSGLFINSLNGFPGAYSAWVQKKLGNQGILRLMECQQDRSAYFKTTVAYVDENGVRAFSGMVEGTISSVPRGSTGFGYDPIFIPESGDGKTFAENETLKNRISHRFNAFTAFARWYANYTIKA